MNPFIPEVEVTKVTLLNAGSLAVRKERSPYIDFVGEGTGAATATGVVQGGMNVKVQMKIKQPPNADFTSKLLEKYLKYFEVRVFVSTSEDILNLITPDLKTFIGTIAGYNWPYKDWSDDYTYFKSDKETTVTKQKNSMKRYHSVDFDIENFVDGEFYIEKVFSLKKEEEYLGLAAHCVVDVDRIKEETSFGSELVFETGKSWVEDQAELSGKITTVSLLDMQNLQDFRSIARSQGSQANLDDLEKLLGLSRIELSNSQKLKKDSGKQKIFSDIFTTLSPKGETRFCFFIDFESLFEVHSLASSLDFIGGVSLAPIKESRIFSFRVKKRQVQNRDGKEVLGKSQIVKFLGDEEVFAFSDAMTKTNGQYFLAENELFTTNKFGQSVSPRIGAIRETLINSDKLRMFEGIDSDTASMQSTHFQYGVEVEVEDPAFEKLKQLRQNIASRLTFLRHYYDNDLLLRKNYNTITQKFSGQMYANLSEVYYYMTQAAWTALPSENPTNLGPGEFCGNFNGFPLAFKDGIKKLLHPDLATPESINLAINSVAGALLRVENIINSFSTSKVYKKDTSGGYAFNTSGQKASPEPRKITLDYWFPTLVDKGSSGNGYEFFHAEDTISTSTADDAPIAPSLARFTQLDLERRFDSESAKFFLRESSFPDFDPKFFSAERIYIQYNPVNIFHRRWPKVQALLPYNGSILDHVTNWMVFSHSCDQLMIEVLRAKQGDRTTITDGNLGELYDGWYDLLAKENCTVTPIHVLVETEGEEEEEKESKGKLGTSPFGNILGPNTFEKTSTDSIKVPGKLPSTSKTFPYELLTGLFSSRGRVVNKLPAAVGPSFIFTMLLADGVEIEGVVDETATNEITDKFYTDFKEFTTKSRLMSLYWLLFENIVEVQYLDMSGDVKVSDLSPHSNKRWKQLNVRERLASGGDQLICRFRRISLMGEFSELVKETELPIFNQYFVLEAT